jgi:tyrosine-protein phosphatase SIW14
MIDLAENRSLAVGHIRKSVPVFDSLTHRQKSGGPSSTSGGWTAASGQKRPKANETKRPRTTSQYQIVNSMQYQPLSRRLAAFPICLCLATAISAGASLPLTGVENFYKVDDQVYRGAQPSAAGFASLAKLGVKTIIDLREIGEHSQAGEEAIVKALGMQYVSIPLRGMARPDNGVVSHVLGLLNDSASAPVFVHCKRGADRTGTIIACYRISHDSWEPKRALSEARGDGMSIFQRSMQKYILHFEPATAATVQPAVVNTPQ